MVISDCNVNTTTGEMNEIRTMKVGDFWRRKDMFEQFGNDRSVKAEI